MAEYKQFDPNEAKAIAEADAAAASKLDKKPVKTKDAPKITDAEIAEEKAVGLSEQTLNEIKAMYQFAYGEVIKGREEYQERARMTVRLKIPLLLKEIDRLTIIIAELYMQQIQAGTPKKVIHAESRGSQGSVDVPAAKRTRGRPRKAQAGAGQP
ncbi:MAG TPA: hypothetical protein VN653_10935 [Anaerolineales bacterium]|nr:hypothetical protein [Anaerolineales bacterium]